MFEGRFSSLKGPKNMWTGWFKTPGKLGCVQTESIGYVGNLFLKTILDISDPPQKHPRCFLISLTTKTVQQFVPYWLQKINKAF